MAILATEKVLTLDYWKPAAKLQVGDYVFDKDGNIVQVKLVQEYRSDDCYEVVFNDYLTVRGDHKLGFLVETPKYRRRLADYKGRHKFRRPLKPMSVDELLTTPLKTKTNRKAISVPTTQPLALPTQPLSIPPFVFGYWFMNCNLRNRFRFVHQKEEYITQKFKDAGYKINKKWGHFTISPSIESQLAPLIPTKIPANYLMASIDQRLELLKGIIHGKPWVYSARKDTFTISSVNYQLILQIQALVESLGMKTTINKDNNYKIWFKSRLPLVENQRSPKLRVHIDRRYVQSIDKLPPQACVYVETTAPNNSILVGEGFIPVC